MASAIRRVGLSAFGQAPVGASCASEHMFVWYPRADLRAVALWGRASHDDVRFFETTLDAVFSHDPAPQRTLTDLRALDGIDPSALNEFVRVLWARRDDLARVVLRAAALFSPDSAGQRLFDFHGMISFPYPLQGFTATREALAWLGDPSCELAYEQDLSDARGGSSLVRALRHALEDALAAGRHEATLAGCARALAVSSRSLQRALQASGSSFRAELRRARVHRAMELLSAPEPKLSAVARAVGFEKLANFNRAFEAETTLTPSAWRLRRA